jgi:hypothetical protein
VYYFLIWDSPNLEGQVSIFIYPRNRVAQLYPWALGSFFAASYDSWGYGRGILTCLPTGGGRGNPCSKMKWKLYCNRHSLGQLVLVSGPFWNRWPDFIFFEWQLLLCVRRPLWWRGGSVFCNAITYCLEPRRAHNHILLSHLRLPQPGWPGLCICIPQEQGGQSKVKVTLWPMVSQTIYHGVKNTRL